MPIICLEFILLEANTYVTMKTETNGEAAEASVYKRYSQAANRVEPALCCPVEYSADCLAVIPTELLERNQAVVYRGPFKKVENDDGHTYIRGLRCD